MTHICASNLTTIGSDNGLSHDDVIKWVYFPRYWPFVRGIHRPPVKSHHKGQWHGALMFSLICVWINGWINNREACDLRRHRAHHDVTVWLGRCQAVNWPNAGVLLIGPLVINFSEIFIEIDTFSFKHMHLNMLSGKWGPFCLGLSTVIFYRRKYIWKDRLPTFCLVIQLSVC